MRMFITWPKKDFFSVQELRVRVNEAEDDRLFAKIEQVSIYSLLDKKDQFL